MNRKANSQETLKYAKFSVDRFVNNFHESYRLLAYYAALPLILTPELLNFLRNRFLRGQVPWIAEVDLLLSDLCRPIRGEQFVLNSAIREYLIHEMKENLGTQRIQEAAKLILNYVRQLSKNPFVTQDELRPQTWAAMAYIDEQHKNVVRDIVQSFQISLTRLEGDVGFECPQIDRTELRRLSRITSVLAPQLEEYPELVEYAEQISLLLKESEQSEAKELLSNLALNKSPNILGVKLPALAETKLLKVSKPVSKSKHEQPESVKKAYRSNFKFDIYISYAHFDNYPLEGKSGWIDIFIVELESFLARRFGGPNKIKIWRDKRELRDNQIFDMTVKEAIEQSAIFLCLYSPAYHKSDFCRKELNWFCNYARTSSYGLVIGESSRLFNVLLRNVPHTEWPMELSRMAGFPMYDATSDSHELSDFADPDGLIFNRQLRKIVDAIETTLNAFPMEKLPEDIDSIEEKQFNIFIGEVADSLAFIKHNLIADLTERQIKILHKIPPPYRSATHDDKITEIMKKADLAIHLLDISPGLRIDDLENKTYPCRQIELGLASSIPQLIWMPKNVDISNIEDVSYREFILRLREGEFGKKIEFITSTRTELANIVQQKIESLKQEKQAVTNDVLIACHVKDQIIAFQLANFLSETGLKIGLSQEGSDSKLSLFLFQEDLLKSKNLVIIAGNISEQWIMSRMKNASQIMASQYDKAKLENLWIYLAPDSKFDPKNISELPTILKVKFLDNRHSKNIDFTLLEPLIIEMGGTKKFPDKTEKKHIYRIYISSTYKDLKEQRETASKVVRTLGHQPVAMEDYASSAQKPVDYYLADVRSSDIFIGIYAFRYGYIPEGYQKSITHLEYEAAGEAGIPRLIFMIDEEALWPLHMIDKHSTKIDQFRELIKKQHIITILKDVNELYSKVIEAVSNLILELEVEKLRPQLTIPAILPYLVDRNRQLQEVEEIIVKCKHNLYQKPLVCIMHGDEHECHDLFIERLQKSFLPDLLHLPPNQKEIKVLRIEFPDPRSSVQQWLGSFKSRLFQSLLNKRNGTIEEMVQALDFHQPPVLIHSSVYAYNWQKYMPELIENWIDFWNHLPDLAIGKKLLVFLSFHYKNIEDMKRFEAKKYDKLNKNMREYIKNLDLKRFANINGLVLTELHRIK